MRSRTPVPRVKWTWETGSDPLEALRAGDPAPFEAFVDSAGAAFVAFFVRQGAGAEAEDLAQDVFLKLYRHAETYEADGRFGAFALRVARNTWIDHTRRRAVRPAPAAGTAEDDEPVEPTALRGADERTPPEPGAVLERDEEARRALAAVQRLSEGHRIVFELAILQGLSYPVIAEQLDIPVGTVKSRMHHAVRRLREGLDGDGAADAGAEPGTGRGGER